MSQSSNPQVWGLSPAGGEKLVVGQTVFVWIRKRFIPLAHFHPPQVINGVPLTILIV